MVLLSKNYFKNYVDRRVAAKKPDRDAIVWSVNEGVGLDWFAYVKLQGSNTLIKARYPQGAQDRPGWLRPGCPVIIRHPGGNRGWMEIVGVGRAIPSPVAGNNFPDVAALPDAIISGLETTETTVPGMKVAVSTGTYRIDGELYSFTPDGLDYIVMDDPAPMVMGDPAPATMGDGQYTVAIDAAPSSGNCRYDILVIGTDGVIDYIAGTAASLNTGPTAPAVPADHLQIARIFVYAGMTEILNKHINMDWTEPKPSKAAITFSGSNISTSDSGSYQMDWDAGDTEPTCGVVVAVKDQYDRASALYVDCTLTQVAGTGSVSVTSGGSFGSTAKKLGFGSSYTFTYKRDETAIPERHPAFQVAFTGYAYLQGINMLILLNVSGVSVSAV